MNDKNLEKFELPLIQKKIIQRSCKGPISIKRVDSSGDYIVIENTCIKKPIVLTNWTLRRRGVDVPMNSFKFEKHFVLHPNKSVKIFANGKGTNNPPYELMSETVKSWSNGTYAYTQLVDHLNQEKASLLEKMEHYERDLQPSVNKYTGTSSTSSNRAHNNNNNNNNDTDDDQFNGSEDGFKTVSRDFEFVYSKNSLN